MFTHLPSNSILEATDVKAIQPKLSCLDYIPRDIATKAQTISFDQEDKTLALLTTNAFPALYYQMIDRLHAQGWQTQTWFTDDA